LALRKSAVPGQKPQSLAKARSLIDRTLIIRENGTPSPAIQVDQMLFMIIERFKDNDVLPIYKRLRDEGRMIPEGLKYVDSWIESNFSRCFQLMGCDDVRLLQEWILRWRGSGTLFEIVPVVSSYDTQEIVAPHLDEP
jgi:hypothetical protein